MTKRGLVLVVGATGSGKSTSLAAMIDHRNRTSRRPHHHRRGPGRVRAPVADVAGHAPRGRHRHPLLAPRAEEHPAPGARRDPDRRDPRRRDDGARDRLRRDRPPLPRHAARQQRQPDDRADHQLLPRGAAQAAADGPLGQPARDRLAAPGAARGRQGPLGGDRDPAQHADHRRAHLQRRVPRDQGHHGAVARARHAHLRRGAVRPLRRRPDLASTRRSATPTRPTSCASTSSSRASAASPRSRSSAASRSTR